MNCNVSLTDKHFSITVSRIEKALLSGSIFSVNGQVTLAVKQRARLSHSVFLTRLPDYHRHAEFFKF